MGDWYFVFICFSWLLVVYCFLLLLLLFFLFEIDCFYGVCVCGLFSGFEFGCRFATVDWCLIVCGLLLLDLLIT